MTRIEEILDAFYAFSKIWVTEPKNASIQQIEAACLVFIRIWR